MSWLWLKIQLNYHSTWVSALLFLPIDAVSLQKQMVPCIQLQQRRWIVKLTWTDSLSSCVSLQSKAQRNKNESNRTLLKVCAWMLTCDAIFYEYFFCSFIIFPYIIFSLCYFTKCSFCADCCSEFPRIPLNSFAASRLLLVVASQKGFFIPSFFILSTQLLPDRWVV